MNRKNLLNAINGMLLLALLVSACTISEQSNNLPTRTRTNSPLLTDTPSKTSALLTSTPEEEKAQPTPSSSTAVTQELVVTLPPTSSLPVTATTPTIPETTLQGPLIGFRVHDEKGIYLLIYDISSKTLREVRNSLTNHPFAVEWVANGCGLYVGDIIDLMGNVIWKMPELNWDQLTPRAAYGSELSRLSPDRQWLAYDVLYGEKYYEGAEFRDIGIVNLTKPSEYNLLTDDGSASLFAWSPGSDWLAYAHKDNQGANQLYRVRPDGQNEQQLTFNSFDLGVGSVVWSPDGRFIAYAVYGKSEGDPGGIGVVDLENFQQFQIMPHEKFVGVRRGEIWWELGGKRLLFSGTSWNGEEEVTEIYWVDALSGTITNSFIGTNGPDSFIRQVYPVSDIDHILFSSRDGYYLLNASDSNRFERFSDFFEMDGQYYDSEVTPFQFPGEINCSE